MLHGPERIGVCLSRIRGDRSLVDCRPRQSPEISSVSSELLPEDGELLLDWEDSQHLPPQKNKGDFLLFTSVSTGPETNV